MPPLAVPIEKCVAASLCDDLVFTRARFAPNAFTKSADLRDDRLDACHVRRPVLVVRMSLPQWPESSSILGDEPIAFGNLRSSVVGRVVAHVSSVWPVDDTFDDCRAAAVAQDDIFRVTPRRRAALPRTYERLRASTRVA